MAARLWLTALAALAALAAASADLPDTQPCPAPCACAYSRISWETDCARRGLRVTPEGLSPDAYSLDLAGNQLERLGPFPAGCRLRRLFASGNRVTALAAEDLAGLDLLVELDLSNNQLARVDPASFRNALGLLTLNLANNLLETPEGVLIASDSLKNLNLRNNRLRALPSSMFVNSSSLGTLDLSDNPLEALPAAALAPLTGLETLTVARCGLQSLDPGALAPLAQLKELDASGNRLGGVASWAPALLPLARLDALLLADAALEGPLPRDTFAGCAALSRLVLSGSPALRDPWAAASALPALADLEVRACGLTELPPAPLRANLSALRLLDASDNALGPALPAGALALPALETLRLSSCGLQLPPAADVFKDGAEAGANVPALEELSLGGNPLRLSAEGPLLPAPAQGSLRTLRMGNCSLRSLPSTALRGAVNLTELQLRDNPMEEMPENSLRELPALAVLDLSGCNLSTIYAHQLSYTPRLRTLRLTRNPWRCGCALRGLWAWAELGKADLGVLENAHNLTCTPDGDEASDVLRWEALASEPGYCPEAELYTAASKVVQRRAAPGFARLSAAAPSHWEAMLLVPVAAVLTAAVVAGVLALVSVSRRNKYCRLDAQHRRVAP